MGQLGPRGGAVELLDMLVSRRTAENVFCKMSGRVAFVFGGWAAKGWLFFLAGARMGGCVTLPCLVW